jgi:hypothetical protein
LLITKLRALQESTGSLEGTLAVSDIKPKRADEGVGGIADLA